MATINFNNALFAQKALQSLVRNLGPIRHFAHDLSGMTGQKGSAIYVPLVSNVTATTFAQSYTGTGGVINSVTVNLNNHRIATVSFTDVQALNSSAATVDNFASQLGDGLADIVLSDILSIVTTGSFGTAIITTSAANWSKTQVRALRKQLNINGAKKGMRSLWVTNEIEDYILGDTNILQAYAYGGAEAIREGNIPRLLGMEVVATDVLGFAGGITQGAFACAPDAIAVAMRGVEPISSDKYMFVDMVSDPETGISMTLKGVYNEFTGTIHLNAECLFGYAAALTRNLVLATVP